MKNKFFKFIKFVICTKTFPIQDDLDRAFCKEAGKLGHQSCGWCKECNKPVFMCGHTKG